MESLGTDLVDQEIGIFGVKTVAEEVGKVKAGLIGDGNLPKWGLGHFTHFMDFIAISSYIKLRFLIGQIQQSLGEGFFTAHQLYQAGEVV